MESNPEYEQSFQPDTDAKGGTPSTPSGTLGGTALGAAGVNKP